MSGLTVENIMVSSVPIAISGVGSTVVSVEAALSDGGAFDGIRVDVVASDVTVAAGITFKLQHCSGDDKDGAAHWEDVGAPLTTAISDTSNGVFSRAIRATYSTYAPFFPLGRRLRVVVTAGAGDSATIEAVRLIQPAE